jgi:hypothetical protein
MYSSVPVHNNDAYVHAENGNAVAMVGITTAPLGSNPRDAYGMSLPSSTQVMPSHQVGMPAVHAIKKSYESTVYAKYEGNSGARLGLATMLLQMGAAVGILIAVFLPKNGPSAAGLFICGTAFFILATVSWRCAQHSTFYKCLRDPTRVVKARDYFVKLPSMQFKLTNHAHCYTSGKHGHTIHQMAQEFRYARSVDATTYPRESDDRTLFSSLCVVHLDTTFQFADPVIYNRFLAEQESLPRLSHELCFSTTFSRGSSLGWFL